MKRGTTSEAIWPNGGATPSDRASDQRSMSVYNRSGQNGSDTTDESTVGDRLPAGATRIGIDEEGRIHYWDRAGSQMLVVELSADLSTRLERIDVSPGAEFHAYVEHADEVCGWDHLSYDENWLGAALGGL